MLSGGWLGKFLTLLMLLEQLEEPSVQSFNAQNRRVEIRQLGCECAILKSQRSAR
jgi:hypothetical protein